MARFDPAFVMEQVALAPSSFELRARNPDRHLQLGAGHHIFASVGGPAFVSDLDKGRRPGTYEEMCDYLRLIQSLNIIHQEGGGPFEAMDLPADTRHLDLYLAQYRLTDKNCQSYALEGVRAQDSVEMACIALETDRDGLLEKPALLAIINTNSPLQLDIPMTEAVDELAAAGQVSHITPFTLAGSMSPATLAGTLVQQTAEVLAVVAYAQTGQAGCASDVWQLCIERRHAQRFTGTRYTGVYEVGARQRTDCHAGSVCRSARATPRCRTATMRRLHTKARCRCGVR